MSDGCRRERGAGEDLTLRLGIDDGIGDRGGRRAGEPAVELEQQGTRMSALLSDTHAFGKELTEVGMPEAQVEVLARSL